MGLIIRLLISHISHSGCSKHYPGSIGQQHDDSSYRRRCIGYIKHFSETDSSDSCAPDNNPDFGTLLISSLMS